ncbi:MAG: efflux RND transporter permease subunit, partial [Acidobacteriota bacterium]
MSSAPKPGTLLRGVISASFRQRGLVLMLLGLGIGLGIVSYLRLSTDVFPDLTVPVFNVITQNASMAPEELELSVTLPVESSLNGLPGVQHIRSTTQMGVSQVTVEFDSEMDYWRARQLVTERLAQVLPQLPAGTDAPLLSSVTNRLNEVYEFLVEGDADPMALRDLAEFDVRYRILAVPGVAAIERLGGELRQLQVQLNPGRMQATGITLDDVLKAVRESNENAPGGFVSVGATEFSVRSLGRIHSADDLRRSVITVHTGTPVTLGDVARVTEGAAVRRGSAHAAGRDVVSCRVIKQFGTDTVAVTRAIRAALDDTQRTLPAGIRLRTVYDQSELIDHALTSVERAILVGSVLVVLVLFVLLGDGRSALIVTVTLPLSVVLAGIAMRGLGAGMNTMTLGGLAISVGILVDAAIIMTENIHHRLAMAGDDDRVGVVLEAATEVGRPIAFATLIIMAVFLPLLLMTGIEGRLYRPLALTVISAMVASLLLSLTLVPALCGWFLKAAPRRAGGAEGVDESDVAVIRLVKRAYVPAISWAFRHAVLVRVLSLAVTVPAVVGLFYVGTEFMPELDEGAFLIQTVLPPEASLEQVDRVNQQVEDVIGHTEGVASVSRRSGRSEETEDPMPHVLSDVLVTLKPSSERADTGEIEETLRTNLDDVPGVTVLFTTPLGMRIDEGLGGTPAELSVRVFGPDLDLLARYADQIAGLARHVRGITDLRVEDASGVPQLQVSIDREAAARVGLTAGAVAQLVRVAVGGEVVSEFWQGQRNYGVLVRLGAPFRTSPTEIAQLAVRLPSGASAPVAQFARVEMASGPSVIRREHVTRRLAVEGSVTGRDLGSVVSELGDKIRQSVSLPTNYYVDFGGQFEQQQRALTALTVAVALAVGLVFVLLFMALGSVSEVFVILLTLPDAFVGGIVAMLLLDQTLNVSSAVGFIGLFGIAVQNGLVLIAQTRTLVQAGQPFDTALRTASIGRMRPKLMTASCAML